MVKLVERVWFYWVVQLDTEGKLKFGFLKLFPKIITLLGSYLIGKRTIVICIWVMGMKEKMIDDPPLRARQAERFHAPVISCPHQSRNVVNQEPKVLFVIFFHEKYSRFQSFWCLGYSFSSLDNIMQGDKYLEIM